MGRINFSDGSYYDGEVVNNLRHGFGKTTFTDGASIEGDWVNNCLVGPGKRLGADDSVFYGYYANGGRCNGLCLYYPKGEYVMPQSILYKDSNSVKNGMFIDYDNQGGNEKYKSGFRIYHAGQCSFILEAPSVTVIFDWFGSAVPAIRMDKPVVLLYSHIHQDHFNANAVYTFMQLPNLELCIIGLDESPENEQWEEQQFDSFEKYMSPENFAKTQTIHVGSRPVSYKKYNMDIQVLESTDMGVAFLLKIDGKTFYHSGDLAVLGYGPLSLKNFTNKLESVKGTTIDYAMISVLCSDKICGKTTLETYNEYFNIKYFTPMHLWNKYEAAPEMLRGKSELLKKTIGVDFDKSEVAGRLPVCRFYQLPI